MHKNEFIECIVCATKFTSFKEKDYFCSDDCENKWKSDKTLMLSKNCKYCYDTFETRLITQKFCSKNCFLESIKYKNYKNKTTRQIASIFIQRTYKDIKNINKENKKLNKKYNSKTKFPPSILIQDIRNTKIKMKECFTKEEYSFYSKRLNIISKQLEKERDLNIKQKHFSEDLIKYINYFRMLPKKIVEEVVEC